MPSKNTPRYSDFINGQLESFSIQKRADASVSGKAFSLLKRTNWADSETGEEHTISTGSAPFKKLRQAYLNQDTAYKAELLKTQRKQGSKLTVSNRETNRECAKKHTRSQGASRWGTADIRRELPSDFNGLS